MPQGSPTKSESAYQRLRAEIIEGRKVPSARLVVGSLSDEFEIGTSPIREALSRLAADGFVTATGQQGFRVAAMSKEDLIDITNTRVLLETEAVRRSIELGDEEWESSLVAAFHSLSNVEENRQAEFNKWERRNRTFHESLVAACNSPWLQRLREGIFDLHRRYRHLAAQIADARDVAGEHREIYQAALSRNVDAAAEVTRTHILNTLEIDLDHLHERLPS